MSFEDKMSYLLSWCEYEAFAEFFTVGSTLHKSNKCIDGLSFNL